jgi:hypothetical protein
LFAFGTLFLFFHTLFTTKRFTHWLPALRIGASALFSVAVLLIVLIVRASLTT